MKKILTILLFVLVLLSACSEQPVKQKTQVQVSVEQTELQTPNSKLQTTTQGVFETVKAGEYLMLPVNVDNDATKDWEDVRVSASIQELGVVSETKDSFDLDSKETKTEQIFLHIPKDSKKGVYYVRVSVEGEDENKEKVSKVHYREVEII